MQTTFSDLRGRQWDLRLTAGGAQQLSTIGVDIRAIAKDARPFIRSLLEDSEPLLGCLKLITKEQRDTLGVTEAEFLNALDGQTLDAAIIALINGIAASMGGVQGQAFRELAVRFPKLLESAEAKLVGLMDQAFAQFEADIEKLGQ